MLEDGTDDKCDHTLVSVIEADSFVEQSAVVGCYFKLLQVHDDIKYKCTT